jgi:hypothetical protein
MNESTPSKRPAYTRRKSLHRHDPDRKRSHEAGNPTPGINVHRVGLACDEFFDARGFKPVISEMLQTRGVVIGVRVWRSKSKDVLPPVPTSGPKKERLDLSKAGCKLIRKAVADAKAKGLLTHATPTPTRMPIPDAQDRHGDAAGDCVGHGKGCDGDGSQGHAEGATHPAHEGSRSNSNLLVGCDGEGFLQKFGKVYRSALS